MKRFTEDNWKDSKYFPFQLESDQSGGKIAFNNMLKEAFKSFPPVIQAGLDHIFIGGNTVFDSVMFFMQAFEAAEGDWMYYQKLEVYEQEIIRLGESFKQLQTMLIECESTLVKWKALKFSSTYEEYVKAATKIRMPTIKIKTMNIEAPKLIDFKATFDELQVRFDGDPLDRQVHPASNFANELVGSIWANLRVMTEDGLFGLLTDQVTLSVKKAKVAVMTREEFEIAFS